MAKTRDDSNQSTHIFLSISRDFFVLSLSFLPSYTSVSPFFSFFFLLGRVRISPTMTTTTTPFVDIRSHSFSFCLATRIIVRVNRSLWLCEFLFESGGNGSCVVYEFLSLFTYVLPLSLCFCSTFRCRMSCVVQYVRAQS